MHFARVLMAACMVFSTAEAAEFNVTIKKSNQLAFDPPYVSSKIGDRINFNFPKSDEDHVLVESTFESPCTPNENMTYVPIPKPGSSITVLNSTAFWFFCLVKDHCRSGMVFAVNPPPHSFDAFKNKAISSPPTPSPTGSRATPTSTSSGYDLKIYMQKTTGLGGVILLVGYAVIAT